SSNGCRGCVRCGGSRTGPAGAMPSTASSAPCTGTDRRGVWRRCGARGICCADTTLEAPRASRHLLPVTDMLRQFGVFLDVARRVFLGLAVVAGAVSIAAWAVRVRRVSPFGMVGRFVRTSVDPLLRPVERVVLRAGGTP